MSRYQKGNTNLDFTEARDSEWQWHQLGHRPMQVCTSLQTDNHANTHHAVFYRPDALPAAQPTELPNSAVGQTKVDPIQTIRCLGLPASAVVIIISITRMRTQVRIRAQKWICRWFTEVPNVLASDTSQTASKKRHSTHNKSFRR